MVKLNLHKNFLPKAYVKLFINMFLCKLPHKITVLLNIIIETCCNCYIITVYIRMGHHLCVILM